MRVPPGHDEASVIQTIERIASLLAHKMAFDAHTAEDLKQQLWIYALEALESGKYDPSRPLDKFMYVHLTNRGSNFRRTHRHRADAPCRTCLKAWGSGGRYCGEDGRTPCSDFEQWRRRNQAKASLSSLTSIDAHDEAEGSEPDRQQDVVEGDELRLLIDDHLPCDLRATYLAMLEGKLNIRTYDRQNVRRAILRLVWNFGDADALGLPSRDDEDAVEAWITRPTSEGRRAA
jgi:DNA-directed RNA polymerase specialized sigma24 family protein